MSVCSYTALQTVLFWVMCILQASRHAGASRLGMGARGRGGDNERLRALEQRIAARSAAETAPRGPQPRSAWKEPATAAPEVRLQTQQIHMARE